MMKRRVVVIGLSAALALSLIGCKKKDSPSSARFPNTEEGAKAMLSEFLKPGADYVKLSLQLRPNKEDYAAVWATPEMAKKAEQIYGILWGYIQKDPIKPKQGQTELVMFKATVKELKDRTGNSAQFPGGYMYTAQHLKQDLMCYGWRYIHPGDNAGMAYDGLYYVNGHWVLMPKPWRVLFPEGPQAMEKMQKEKQGLPPGPGAGPAPAPGPGAPAPKPGAAPAPAAPAPAAPAPAPAKK